MWFLAPATIIGLLSLLSSATVSANLFDGDEPLAPEVAFKPEVEALDANTITISFDVSDGYYLYRDKLSFTAQPVSNTVQNSNKLESLLEGNGSASVSLDAPVYPEAQTIEDDYFGVQAVFRGLTSISLPYTSEGLDAFTLSVKYQGCADIGLCYPPTTVEFPLELPEQGITDSRQSSSDLTSPLMSPDTGSSSSIAENMSLSDALSFGTDTDELLPPEVAYLPQIESATNAQIRVSWFIEDGYYLYRDKLNFSLTTPDSLDVGAISVSEGIEEHDEFYGNVSVLRHSAQVLLDLENTGVSEIVQTGELTIYYQGCADIGVCFPPSQVSLPVTFSGESDVIAASAIQKVAGKLALDVTNETGGKPSLLVKTVTRNSDASGSDSSALVSLDNNAVISTTVASDALPAQSEHSRLSGFLSANSVWLTIATFFGLGLLLAFTPCVLPMIPILSSLIVGRGQNISGARAFQLSSVYVLVMASTYALVGIFVGLSGYNIQAFFQNPVVLTGIALLFVVLSLSMFGFYELQAPTALQSKLSQISNRQGSGQFGGVAAMGFISTLVVGPCVTAPLAGALLYIAKTGDAVVGGAALFALGLGMGAPLLLIGTSAGKLLPKSGAWMDSVKYLFGILLLGMAIYMLSRFLPATITMALYGILAFVSGIYLGAFDSITSQSRNRNRFGKGVGLLVSVYGLALLVGALAGANSYTRPLGAIAGGASSTSTSESNNNHSLPFQPVKSVENLQAAVARASAEGKPLMLDFYADWCVSCKEMDALTFSDERVQSLLENALVVQADVTANDAQDQELLKHFDLFGPPGIIFYDKQGAEIPAAEVVGFMKAADFAAHIERFISFSDI